MSTEMKKLIIGGTEYEIVDETSRQNISGHETRITALEQDGGESETGLTQAEKNYILALFEKATYSESDASTAFNALKQMWIGYSVEWAGSGYSKGNHEESVRAGGSFTSTVTANTGFTLTSVTVEMGGNTVQGAWNEGTVTIPNVTGNIIITVTTSQISVSSISAVYTQSGDVYSSTILDDLKPDLVVTATFMDSTTGVINPADYTLSGTLTQGTSTITVSYGGKSTTFDVEVVQTYTSSTGKEYTKVFTIDAGRKTPTALLDEYGLMENLESLTITGLIINTQANSTTTLPNLSTYAPNLKRFILAPTSFTTGNVIKFGHYPFTGIPASLIYIQLGHVNSTIYWQGGGYFRNDGDTAGLSNKYMVGNTNGLELVVYTDAYKATNGGFANGTTAPTTTITQYLYTDGSPLTAS